MTTQLRQPAAGALCLFVASLVSSLAAGQDPLLTDPDKRWIQDDIGAGYARAKATGKPLLVAFR